MSIFKQVAAKTTKAKKSDLPEFTVSDQSLIKEVKKWIIAKSEEKTAKANIERSEALLLNKSVEEHLKTCQNDEKYYASIKAITNEENPDKIIFTFTNKYSKISTENEAQLKEIYGMEYNKYFKEKTIASLTDKAIEDSEFVSRITQLIGEENFSKYFKAEVYIEPKDEYHENRMINQSLAEKHQQAIDAGLIKCNKPSLRVG